jgi:hypothetical protein
MSRRNQQGAVPFGQEHREPPWVVISANENNGLEFSPTPLSANATLYLGTDGITFPTLWDTLTAGATSPTPDGTLDVGYFVLRRDSDSAESNIIQVM